MKFCLIVGTRPQIIKSQPVVKEILSRKLMLRIIHTGQHYDYEMSKAFFHELKIKNPDYNLAVSSGSSPNQLGEIISKLEKPLKKIQPDIVLVPGDTRSALGAALSANRLGIPIAHIEAGARGYDFKMEEEINRRLIDHCSNFLFAPTPNCYNNLKKESVLGDVFFTGDTMYDVFLDYKKLLKLKNNQKDNFVLMTVHRRENIQDYYKIKKIIDFAKKISTSGYELLFPIHPHTKKQTKNYKLSLKSLHTIKPLKYSELLKLLSKAQMLLTDSGGLQKEAFWLNTPCVTFRDRTEWIETLRDGRNTILNPEKKWNTRKIISILDSKKHLKRTKSQNLFGNGRAAKKIVSILLK